MLVRIKDFFMSPTVYPHFKTNLFQRFHFVTQTIIVWIQI
jgi:hypothetical protein